MKKELQAKNEVIKLIISDKNQNESVNFTSKDINTVHTSHTSTKKKKKNEVKNNDRKKNTVTILGDSMIKQIKSKSIKNNNSNGFIKSFPGSTVSQMHHYAKPSLEYNPEIVILQCGTNDLRSQKSADDIANDIINLATDMKNDEDDIYVSSITPRSDKLHGKALDVNEKLKQLCIAKSMDYIDNCNILETHLSFDGLHLSFKGSVELGKKFSRALSH